MPPPSYSYNPGNDPSERDRFSTEPTGNREFSADMDGSPDGAASVEQIDSLIGSQVELQFREMEQNFFGDPFRNLQRASELFEAKMGRHGSILDQVGDQLARSSGYNFTQREQYRERTGLLPALQTGLVFQPQSSFYEERFGAQGATVQGTIFQLQQREVVSSLIGGGAMGRVFTQVFEAGLSDSTTGAQIVGPNEISLRASRAAQELRGQRGVRIEGVRAMGSFHAKVGYVQMPDGEEYAFLGAQNITPAIERGSSFNPVLSLRSYASIEEGQLTAAQRVERGLLRQVQGLTRTLDETLGGLGGDRFYVPGSIRQSLGRRNQTPNIAAESDILPRLNSALEFAAQAGTARSDLTVLISSAEVGLLLSAGGRSGQGMPQEVARLRSAALQLARQGQLVLITGDKTIERVMQGQDGGVDALGLELTDLLLSQKTLRLANTGYLHDKTVAVIDRRKQELLYLNTGSANLTNFALQRIEDIAENPVVSRNLERARGVSEIPESAMAETFNFEANIVIGDFNGAASAADEREYLATLAPGFLKTYSSLSGLSLGTTDRDARVNRPGFVAEARASSDGVRKLRQEIDRIRAMPGFGDLITVRNRYDLDRDGRREEKLQGLEVSIQAKGGVGLHRATFFLTVQGDGTVVFSDRNKVVTGSTFVNKSSGTRTIAGIQVASGASQELSGIQTAAGLVSTMAYALETQSTLGLPNQFFRDQLESGVADQTSRKLLSSLLDVVGGAKLGSFGVGLNSTNTLERLAEAIDQNPNALRELRGVMGNRAADMAKYEFRTHSQLAGLSSEQLIRRAEALASVFDVFTTESTLGSEERIRRTVYRLNYVLNNDYTNDLADLRAAYTMSDPVSRGYAQSLARSETKEIEAMVLAPFQEPSSLMYSSQQARHRRPVYGITAETEAIPNNLDVLNPITVRPGVKVGQPGEMIQLIGASGYVRSTIGATRLAQMQMTKEELGSGAVSLYNTKGIFNSTPNLSHITPEQRLQQIQQAAQAYQSFLVSHVGYDVTQAAALAQSMVSGLRESEEDLIYVPFAANKLEQVQQRLKNTLGARPSMVGNPEMYEKLAKLDPNVAGSDIRREINAGSLRTTLSDAQFQRVQQLMEEYGGDYDKVLAYLRDQELNPLNTDRGYLTTEGLKTVAMNVGVNFMGDFSYTNPGVNETLLESSVMSLRFSTKGIEDVQGFTSYVTEKLSQGARIFGRPVEVSIGAMAAHGFQVAVNEEGHVKFEDARAALRERQAQDEYFKMFMVRKDDRGNAAFMMREGVYALNAAPDGSERFERIGGVTSQGLIVIGYGSRFSSEGEFVDPLTKKSAAFTKRYLDGITVMPGIASIEANLQRGTVTVTSEAYTMTVPQSGMRSTGPALDKGAVVYLQQGAFNYLGSVLQRNNINQRQMQGVYKGGELSNSATGNVDADASMIKLYGMFSFNTVKGYNFGTGIHYITSERHKKVLAGADSLERARAAAMLFMSGSPSNELGHAVRKAYIGSYQRNNQHIMAARAMLSNPDDYSTAALGQHAAGLNLLASPGFEEGGKPSIHKTLIAALGGQQEALEHIDKAFSHLFDLVGNTDPANVGLGAARMVFRDADGNSRVVVNDRDPLVRSAALLADALFTSQAIMGAEVADRLGSIRFAGDGAGTLPTQSYVEKYTKDASFRTKVDSISLLAGKPKLPEPPKDNSELSNNAYKKAVERRLKELQALMDAQVVVERAVDYQYSSSLAPYGSKDSVSMEYHLTAGTTTAWLNRLKPFIGEGEDGASIQRAYGALLLLSKPGAVRSSGMMVEYGLPSLGDSLGNPSHRLGINSSEESPGRQRTDIEYRRHLHWMTHLGLFESDAQMERVHFAIRGGGSQSEVQRAVALNIASDGRFKYISQGEDQARQLSAIQSRSGATITLGEGESLFDRMVELYSSEIVRFGGNLNDDKNKGTEYQSLMTFQDYLRNESANSSAAQIERSYGFMQSNRGGTGMPVSRRMARDAASNVAGAKDVVRQRVREYLAKMNERSLEKLQEDLSRTEGQRYLQAIVDLRQSAQIEGPDSRSQAVLSAVTTSKHYVLPAFKAHKTGDGYTVNFMDASVAKPTQGVLLGADVLTYAAVSFPGFDSQLLTNQFKAERLLAQAHDLLNKAATGQVVSQEELSVIGSLYEAVHSTKDAPMQILESEMTRRAYSDRMDFYGASAGAVDSLALDFNEVVVGDRARVIHENNPTSRVLKRQIDQLDGFMLNLAKNPDGQGASAMDLITSSKVYEQTRILLGSENKAQMDAVLGSYQQKLAELHTSGSLAEGMADTSNARTEGRSKTRVAGHKEAFKKMRAQLYAVAIGVQNADIEGMSTEEIVAHLKLQEGATNRAGSPTGASLLTQEHNLSRVRTSGYMNQAVEQDRMRFKLETSRAQMLVMMPTLSWMLPQGGDFDGDFYTFISGTRGMALRDLDEIDMEISQKKLAISRLERALSRPTVEGADPALERPLTGFLRDIANDKQQELSQLRMDLDSLEQKRQKFFDSFDAQYGTARKDSKDLSQLKKWAGAYMLMPEWMEDYATTAEAIGSVEQMRALFSGINDNADVIQASDRKAAELASLVTKHKALARSDDLDAAAQQIWDSDATTHARYGTVEDLASNLKLVRELEAQERAGIGFEYSNEGALKRQITTALYRNVTSHSAGLNNLNKQFGKASGILSSMSEFDNLQGTMQQAGALLGVAYNSLIPLVDQAVFQNSFGMVAAQVNASGRNFREELRQRLLGRSGGDEVISRMGLDTDEGFQQYMERTQSSVSSTVTFISGMQQAVRDALKQKQEAGGLAGSLERFQLSKKLQNIDSQNIPEAEKDRMRGALLREFMAEQYKSIDISSEDNNPFNQFTAPGSPSVSEDPGQKNKGYDWGMSGFGAMFALAEYQQAATDDDLYKLIEGNERWRAAYEAQSQRGRRPDADTFIATQLSDVITRTQAAFIGSRISSSDSVANAYVENTRRYYEAARAQGGSALDTESFQVAAKFFEKEGALRSQSTDTVEAINAQNKRMGKLRSNFIHAMTYVEARRRGVMSVERMQGLREQRQVGLTITQENAPNQQAYQELEDRVGRAQMQVSQEFRRGKMFGAQEMVGVVDTELQAISDYAQQEGVSHEDAARMLFMMGANFIPEDTELSNVFVRALVDSKDANDNEVGSLLADFTTHTASTAELLSIQAEKGRLAQMLMAADETGESVLSGQNRTLATAQLNELQNRERQIFNRGSSEPTTGRPDSDVERMLNDLNDFTNSARAQLERDENAVLAKQQRARQDSSQRGEIFGALLVPALFAFGASGGPGAGFDSRLGGMALDIFQSIPEIAQIRTASGKHSTLFGEIANVNQVAEQASKNFRRARVTDQIREHGLAGIGSAIAQEMLYAGSSILAQRVVAKAYGDVDGTKIGGIGRVATELISGALASGFSRRMSRNLSNRDRTEAYSGAEQLTDMLTSGLEAIQVGTQKALEGIQESIQNAGDETISDGDSAETFDFTAALPSELEQDIETGMVVVDEGGNELEQESDNSVYTGVSSYRRDYLRSLKA